MILLSDSLPSNPKKLQLKPRSQLSMLKIVVPAVAPLQSRCKLNITPECDNRVVIENQSVIISLQESAKDTLNSSSSINYSKYMLERWQRLNSKLPLVD